jgi:predicted metal-dependent hydrolase
LCCNENETGPGKFDQPLESGEYELRISRKARRLRIDVSARRGVVVVVPAGTPQAAVREFIDAKQAWVQRARARVAAQARELAQPDEAVPSELELRALGRCYRVECTDGERPRVACRGSRVRLAGATDEAHARALLTHWLKRRARERIGERLRELAEHHGFDYKRINVRGQRTRWASCSSRGTISLNYKLLFLPPELVDHVLLHELAHTRHLNHSQRFWRLLARLDPDWRQHHEALGQATQWLPAWVEMDDGGLAAGAID